MHKLRILVFTLISLTFVIKLNAVKAYPYPIKITQADGSELNIQLHGDERYHYHTTTDGYLITRTNGIYNYAKFEKGGRVRSTNVRVSNIGNRSAAEKKLLRTVSPVNPSRLKSIVSAPSRILSSTANSAIQKSFPLTGSPKSLVILVNFSDTSFVTPNPKTAFTNLLNQQGYSTNGGTGSAKDYFMDNSSNKFSPEFDVVGPYTLPNKMSFYGGNDTSGDDKNPRQMVIDACKLAYDNGTDFTQYDTDNDGYVDNIFIYYAGYNEAEGGPENSVWPHRWQLLSTGTKFNGKIISDYACTSELRGRTGTNMCGIGTFVHEFGHVLGLPDMYNTNNDESYNTLSYWDVMDAGPYLNAGRTPPAYSAYERFYLDWLVPTELRDSANYSIEPLLDSNKAYLISQYGNHNLNGQNPSPVEFFLMENRQKSGWDKYLPGHGLIVSHIFYNASDWQQNQPNNDQSAMGVDIVEADGNATVATLATDPFPVTSQNKPYISTFTPTLRSGMELENKSLSLITENNNNIEFLFSSQQTPKTTAPIANAATDATTGSFTANWSSPSDANGSYLTVYSISEGSSIQTEGFDNGLLPNVGWTINASNTGTSNSYIGEKSPSIQFTNDNDSIVTENYILPVVKLTFFVRSLDAANGYIHLEGKSYNAWSTIKLIPITSTLNETKSFEFSVNQNFTKFRLSYKKTSGSIYIDDISATFDQNLEFLAHEKWTTTDSYTLMDLKPNQTYYYKVRASKRVVNSDQIVIYDNYSDFSNTMEVTTLENKSENIFRVLNYETIEVLVPTTDLVVRVYNLLGQQVKTIVPTSTIFKIEDLPKGQVYIIEAGEQRAKIML